jgi:hypothetical protein
MDVDVEAMLEAPYQEKKVSKHRYLPFSLYQQDNLTTYLDRRRDHHLNMAHIPLIEMMSAGKILHFKLYLIDEVDCICNVA